MENEPQKALETQTNPAPATNNPGATDNKQLELDNRIDRAGSAAIAQHTAEQPIKRGRGRPRKYPLPVGTVVAGPGPAPLGGTPQTIPVEFGGPESPTFYDETAVKAVVGGIIEQLNDMAAAFQRMAAMKFLRDSTIAEEAAKAARMSPRVQEMVETGAMLLVKKYSVDMSYAPEIACAGGLAIWIGGNALNYQRLKAEGKKLENQNEKAM